jgi:Zn-dependent protease with chaperone function
MSVRAALWPVLWAKVLPMDSTSPDSNSETIDAVPDAGADRTAAMPATYFDGRTNRRHLVALGFGSDLDISEGAVALASWRYDDLRRADGGEATLRLKCVSGPPLARLEVPDPAQQADIRARARFLDVERGTAGQTGRIVAWSMAAVASIVAIVLFGVPLVAARMVPLIPPSFDRRLGEVVDKQVRVVFSGKVCATPKGSAAFAKLVEALRQAGHLNAALQTAVVASPVPNAFALPGGKIYLLNGLLQKAESADEIAGVMAHEMGHVAHRDQMRMLIQSGGTSFLMGLLLGDITGSGAVIFATRQLFQASYSREAEQSADAFAISTMHALGRSPAAMGELLFRVTGAQGSNPLGILASHPLTEDRRALMRREDGPPTGPEILSVDEWRALKAICVAPAPGRTVPRVRTGPSTASNPAVN